MSGSGDDGNVPPLGGLPYGVDPALLKQMLGDLPPEILNMMGPVQAALQSADPMAALSKLRESGVLPDAPDMAGLNEGIASMMGTFGKEVASLEDALNRLGPMLDKAGDFRAHLERFQQQMSFTEEDEAALLLVLNEVKSMNIEPHLSAILSDSEGVTGEIKKLLDGLNDDPVSQATAFGALRSSLDALEASSAKSLSPSQKLKQILPLMQHYAELASKREHPLSAVFLARLAALRESLSESDKEIDTRDLADQWEGALNAAIANSDLKTARLAGVAIQIRAAKAHNFALVAEIGSRIASLAETMGEKRLAVMCRTEEAQAYAQSGIPEAGRSIAKQAIESAKDLGDKKLIARAKITLGQVMQWAQEVEQAREYFETLISELEGDQDLEHYLGRALLALAKSHQGDVPLALLQRAQEIGLKQRDSIVYVPISLGLANQLAKSGDTNEALSVLVQARVRAVAMAGPRLGKSFDDLAGQFEEEWGGETFQAALLAFKREHLASDDKN